MHVNRLKEWSLWLAIIAMMTPTIAQAKKKKARPVSADAKLLKLRRAYVEGDVSESEMWAKLGRMNRLRGKFSNKGLSNYLQLQAHLLEDAGYPILSAIYASQAITNAKNPLDKGLNRSWNLLHKASQDKPIHNLLELVADKANVGKRTPEKFGDDWFYFRGSALERAGKNKAATAMYSKMDHSDRHYMSAKYQEAMLRLETKDYKGAEVALRAILNSTVREWSGLSQDAKEGIINYTRMALGRVYYETRKFPKAIQYYRQVDRDSTLFYDSLFEQSWAFFLGGYPNHALGGLHSVDSPFFKDQFNPEAPVLRAMIYYWLCRYEDSRNALADFTEKYSDGVSALTKFLDRQRLSPETAYNLFENLVSGVSEKSLGIPKSILVTAAERDSMLFVRDQYAEILEEKERLGAKGVFGSKKGVARPMKYLDTLSGSLRTDLGRIYLSELRGMKAQFDQLYSQAEFLYVELLMSEKEQLLGRELHASSKITKVSDRKRVKGWTKNNQTWNSNLDEFWWDEVGYYIYKVEPACTVNK